MTLFAAACPPLVLRAISADLVTDLAVVAAGPAGALARRGSANPSDAPLVSKSSRRCAWRFHARCESLDDEDRHRRRR